MGATIQGLGSLMLQTMAIRMRLAGSLSALFLAGAPFRHTNTNENITAKTGVPKTIECGGCFVRHQCSHYTPRVPRL